MDTMTDMPDAVETRADDEDLDLSQFLGNPDRLEGGLRDMRLRAMLGDQIALEMAREPIKELARQSRRRRESGDRSLGPYLDVRHPTPKEKNRRPMVVIQDGRRQRRTGIPYKDGVAPEDHAGALEELGDYSRPLLARDKTLRNPGDIPLGAVFKGYLTATEPPEGCADYAFKLKSHQRDLGAGWWLASFGKGKTIDYVDEDFGRKFRAWRLKQPARLKRQTERRDSAIEKEQYLAQAAFRWLKRKLRKARVALPDLGFTIVKAPKRQKRALTWTEMEWLLLACRGFQREGYSFKKKIEVRHGVAREVWDRLDDSATRWLIRFFMTYFCTGTRFARNEQLLWGLNDGVGSLDPDGTAVWRSGRDEAVNDRKPAGRSPLVTVFARMVPKWYRQDLARSKKWGHPPVHVLHDGEGNPLRNVEALVVEVFRRAGLKNSAHIMKHTLVTLFALAGLTLDEIAEKTDTDRGTLLRNYLYLPWIENEVQRRLGTPEVSRLIDIKRKSPVPIPPEVAAEAIAERKGGRT